MIKNKLFYRLFLTLLFFLLLSGSVSADSSTNYQLEFDLPAINSSGGQATSANYNLRDSVPGINAEIEFPAGPYCGNGTKETGEECDGTDFDSTYCTSYGYNSGSLSCTVSCTIDSSACHNASSGSSSGGGGGGNYYLRPICGNGTLESGEECENNNNCNTGEICEKCACIKIEESLPAPSEKIPEENEAEIPSFIPKEENINIVSSPSATPKKEIAPPLPTSITTTSIPEEITPQGNGKLEEEKEGDSPSVTLKEKISPYLPASVISLPKTEEETGLFRSKEESFISSGVASPKKATKTIDTTPLIAGQLEKNKKYKVIVTTEKGGVISEETVSTSQTGKFIYEPKKVLSKGIYQFQVHNIEKNTNTIATAYDLEIGSTKKEYRKIEINSFAKKKNIKSNEEKTISLGRMEKVKEKLFIKGYAEPFATIFAYFQSEIKIVKTTTDKNGYFEIKIPEDLETGGHTVRILQKLSDGTVSENLTYEFELVSPPSEKIEKTLHPASPVLKQPLEQPEIRTYPEYSRISALDRCLPHWTYILILLVITITVAYGYNEYKKHHQKKTRKPQKSKKRRA